MIQGRQQVLGGEGQSQGRMGMAPEAKHVVLEVLMMVVKCKEHLARLIFSE